MRAITTVFISVFLSCIQLNAGNPVVRYSSGKITLKISDKMYNEVIPVEQLSGNDTIKLNVNDKRLEFGIYTDMDSLVQVIPLHTTLILNLIKEGLPPLWVAVKNGLDTEMIQFDRNSTHSDITFKYDENMNSEYLQKLRAGYPIDSLANLGRTDFEKARILATWVHGLWEHDGWNEPKQRDALYILDEVKKGQRFRCVEYGIVTTACLNAIGLKSRTLALKTKDVETSSSGAGHVLMEFYLNDLNKWVMIDPQFDMITLSEGIPLNAVELQQAITEGKDIEMITSEKESESMYLSWLYPYLYYFSVPFDNRENIGPDQRHTVDGKRELMLVPLGVKEPTVFQRKYPISNCIYTHSLKDFYRKP